MTSSSRVSASISAMQPIKLSRLLQSDSWSLWSQGSTKLQLASHQARWWCCLPRSRSNSTSAHRSNFSGISAPSRSIRHRNTPYFQPVRLKRCQFGDFSKKLKNGYKKCFYYMWSLQCSLISTIIETTRSNIAKRVYRHRSKLKNFFASL